MANRLVRWFTYNVTFALLPLACSLLLRALAGKLNIEDVAKSPEVLFFSLIVCATALGDLSEVAKPIGRDITLKIFRSVLLFGAVFSAILYGSLLYDTAIGPGSAAFRSRLLTVSVLMAVAFFILSTVVEAILGKIEDRQ